MTPFSSDFPTVLAEFVAKAKVSHLSYGSANNYQTYLRALNSANRDHTISWIKDSIAECSDFDEFMEKIQDKFDAFLKVYPSALGATSAANAKSAFRKFAIYLYSSLNSTADFASASGNDFELAQLVAQTAIFADPQTVQAVIGGAIGRKENLKKGNPYASWDNLSSIRAPKQKGQTIQINGKPVYCDDNTRANHAIKSAVLHSIGWKPLSAYHIFKGFEACHVYNLVKDPRYYTSVMNLVLVPRALAALTDHNSFVSDVLKYRVYQLFDFSPSGSAPTMPVNYNKIIWR